MVPFQRYELNILLKEMLGLFSNNQFQRNIAVTKFPPLCLISATFLELLSLTLPSTIILFIFILVSRYFPLLLTFASWGLLGFVRSCTPVLAHIFPHPQWLYHPLYFSFPQNCLTSPDLLLISIFLILQTPLLFHLCISLFQIHTSIHLQDGM